MGDADDTNEAMLQLRLPPQAHEVSAPPAPAIEESGPRPVVLDPDHALVVAARDGDRGAFDALVIKHQQRVFAMCSRLLRNPSDVDDAVQQTFLEAWRCLHRFEGKSRFTTWLTRIAINTTFSLRRRVKRWVLVDQLGASERTAALAVIEGGVDPDGNAFARGPLAADEVLARRRHNDALQEVLSTLSEKKRVVFVLIELEGLSSPECGEVLGVPEATVRTRLFYARKEVGEAMATHPAFADVMEKLHGGRGGDELRSSRVSARARRTP
jgi:RNA polymerase sigma-70 factor (ECF subfamily)